MSPHRHDPDYSVVWDLNATHLVALLHRSGSNFTFFLIYAEDFLLQVHLVLILREADHPELGLVIDQHEVWLQL